MQHYIYPDSLQATVHWAMWTPRYSLATLEVGDIGGGCLARAGLEPTTSSTIAQ